MKLKVIKYDLLTIDDPAYYFAHCISSDFVVSDNTGVSLDLRYHLRAKLETTYPEVKAGKIVGDALLIDNVFNLVVKKYFDHKATYSNLASALLSMKRWVINKKIQKIGMPMICNGYDGLEWDSVETLIRKTFENNDVKITVCRS